MLFYVFIFLIPLAVWIALQIASKRNPADENEAGPGSEFEECALCHEAFPMKELVEKEVGGYSRVYCFCGDCIEQLRREYRAKVESTSVEATDLGSAIDSDTVR